MWPVAVDAGWCPTLMPFAGLVHATLVLCVWPAKSSQLPVLYLPNPLHQGAVVYATDIGLAAQLYQRPHLADVAPFTASLVSFS